MNIVRCVHCGIDLSEADAQAARCPSCGRVPGGATSANAPEGQAATLRPTGDAKDTDPTGGMLQTVAFGQGPSTTGNPSRVGESDVYDFLAPPQNPDEIGRLGSYRVLKVLGAGGMGVVFEAEDAGLQRRVAVKAMLPILAVSASARQRFIREARAAAAVEHPRIVPIYQVGEDRGVPFLVMPLLKGESLEDCLTRIRRFSIAESIRIGRQIAEALAAAHECGLVHRDIKPANVWLEGAQAAVKLLDFGLARAAESDTPLTQQGSIVGTPAFMAPEQASGDSVDPRCDLFSLGCVLYRMTTGSLPFQGTSAVSTLLAIVSREPTTPHELLPEIPAELSKLILHLLAKKPADRPASALAVIQALDAIQPAVDQSQSGAGVVPPPSARSQKTHTALAPALPPTQPSGAVALPSSPPIPAAPARSVRRRAGIVLLGFAGLAILVGLGTLVVLPFLGRPTDQPGPDHRDPAIVGAKPETVEIGIAFGTEKQGWFKEAVTDFAATAEGTNIKVNLLPMGSLEGGEAVATNEDRRIHVWSPASSLYKDTFVRSWRIKHPGHNPILKEESLALTPIVFVMWKERYDAFVAKYKTISFPILAKAMNEKQGWGGIADRPGWGRFRFGHTNPTQSNSGLMTLVLMAYDLNNKERDLTHADVTRAEFQNELETIKGGLAGMPNSSGNMMKDMVSKGPSAFDAIVAYECVAIDYVKAARGRWGDLHVAYPTRNMWSENPYYILDVPWSSKEQRQAAEAFQSFLLSEPAQKKALAHGLRPANINVPILGHPDSPFEKYKSNGLSLNISALCDPPAKPILDNLFDAWKRAK